VMTYTIIDSTWPFRGFKANEAPCGNEMSNPAMRST
jgi:hypothetical protein